MKFDRNYKNFFILKQRNKRNNAPIYFIFNFSIMHLNYKF